MSLKCDLIVSGGGGHASVVVDLAEAAGISVKGCIGPEQPGFPMAFCPYLGDDNLLDTLDREHVQLANGLGWLGSSNQRTDFFRKAKQMGFEFREMIHPSAVLAATVSLDEGVQVMAGVVVNPFAQIGENTIVNTGSIVEHHSVVGAHCHLAPGSTICGDVRIGDSTFIGAGATVIQGISIGDCAFVAAGSVVTRDVPSGGRVMGVPAQ